MALRQAILLVLILICNVIFCHDTLIQKTPSQYFHDISSEPVQLENKLKKHSEKAIEQLSKQEEEIKSKPSRLDSLAAKDIFIGADNEYNEFEEKLKKAGRLSRNIPLILDIFHSLP